MNDLEPRRLDRGNNYETICQVSKMNYSELTNKPALFSGSWNNLSDEPTILTEAQVETLITNNAPTAGANIEISATNVISTGTPSQWTTTGANIHYTGGNVAIGTTHPLGKLDEMEISQLLEVLISSSKFWCLSFTRR